MVSHLLFNSDPGHAPAHFRREPQQHRGGDPLRLLRPGARHDVAPALWESNHRVSSGGTRVRYKAIGGDWVTV